MQSRKSVRLKAPKSLHTAEYRNLVAMLIATRHKAKLTQRELAARLGWPYAVIARIELGKRRLDVIEFGDYARGLGMHPRQLYDLVLKG